MRRDPLEIIEDIFRTLERERSALTINQIAKMTGIHNITVRKYIRLIEIIKNEKVDVIKTRHSIIIRMVTKDRE